MSINKLLSLVNCSAKSKLRFRRNFTRCESRESPVSANVEALHFLTVVPLSSDFVAGSCGQDVDGAALLAKGIGQLSYDYDPHQYSNMVEDRNAPAASITADIRNGNTGPAKPVKEKLAAKKAIHYCDRG